MPLSVGYTSVSPIGELFYASRSGGFQSAVAQASVSGGTVVVTEPTPITSAQIIPANVGIRFEEGGSFVLNNTSTLASPSAPTLTQGMSGAVPLGTYYVSLTYVNAYGETTTGTAASITLTNVLSPPTIPSLSTNTTGGTVSAGTYSVYVTYTNSAGETTVSPAASITTVGSTSTITITSPVASGNATGWYAYVTQNGGSVYIRQQFSPSTIGTAYTLTAPPTTSTAWITTGYQPPTSNTASTASLQISSPVATGNATGWYAYCTQAGNANYDGVARQQTTPSAVGTAYTLTTVPASLTFTVTPNNSQQSTPVGPYQPAANTTAVLTLLGSVHAPVAQIFSGSGIVSLGPNSCKEVFPQWWGAVGDTRTTLDASVTSGSAIVTSAGASFTQADVGKVLTIGGTYTGDPRTNNPPAIIGTVASVQSATQCTASVTSVLTGTGQALAIGTDSTLAIQVAINTASGSGIDTVFVPSGGYFITQQGASSPNTAWGGYYSVLLQPNVVLKLQKNAMIIAEPYNPTTMGGATRATFLGRDGVCNWTIKGGKWWGQYGNFDLTEVSDWPVFARGCANWQVKDTEMWNWGGKFVMCAASSGYIANNCRLYDNEWYFGASNYLTFNYATGIRVIGNYAHDILVGTGAEGFPMDYVQDVVVRDNRVINVGTVTVDGTNVIIDGNIVYMPTSPGGSSGCCIGAGVQLNGSPIHGVSQRCANYTIKGNICNVNGRFGTHGIEIQGYVDAISVEGNEITGDLYVQENGGSYATGVTLKGNRVIGAGIGETSIAPTIEGNNVDGGLTSSSTYATIRGNTCGIGGGATTQLRVSGANSVAANNIVYNTSGGGGWALWCNANNCTLIGNRVSQTNTLFYPPITLENAQYCKVTDNEVIYGNTTQALPYIAEVGTSDYNDITNNKFIGAQSTYPYSGGYATFVIGPHSIYRGNTWNIPGAISQPAVPLSTTAYTNNLAVDCMVYVSGGTVTAIAIGTLTTGLTSGGFLVKVGQSITLTYSVAPTWEWVPQ